jgi:hypothetical protein
VIACIAEDRASCEISVKLVLLSLSHHCPDLAVELFYPPADSCFMTWLKGFPNVALNKMPIEGSSGFNVKPQVVLELLDRGHKDVIWIDSDIIVTRNIAGLFSDLGASTFVVTEEALGGRHNDYGGERARRWGFQVGRNLPFAVNTAVLRVTEAHRALLECWRRLLSSDAYLEAQRCDWRIRPWHMLTDQDVLTGVLSSREFAQIPIKALVRGRDIIQFFGPHGYTIAERATNIIYGSPPFIHSQGAKPWDHAWKAASIYELKQYLRAVYLDLSPYTLAARQYRKYLSNDTDWMNSHFRIAKIFRALGFWYAPLVGVPLALIWDIQSLGKGLSKRINKS